MSKYTPMTKTLKSLPVTTKEITLKFDQLERITNDPLPPSAFKYREWWSNEEAGRHVQAHSWMNAGWLVETVNLQSQWVRFRRAD